MADKTKNIEIKYLLLLDIMLQSKLKCNKTKLLIKYTCTYESNKQHAKTKT